MSVTFVTLALAEDAPGNLAEDWMAEANACPFWIRLIRLAIGVFGLKNAIQLAVISATALPPVADAEGEAVDEEPALGLGAELELEVEPLLPQAATLEQTAHSSMISGIDSRVFTETFSSLRLILATSCLTVTSAWRRDRARRSASPAAPARNPGTAGEAAA